MPDIQNTLDKDEMEEPVAMASIDPLPPYPQLSALRSRYYKDEPGKVQQNTVLVFLFVAF